MLLKTSLLVLAAAMASSGLARSEENTYPRPELLVEPTQLAKEEVAKSLVILDARERAKYDQGHIPGALWVEHATWARLFGDGSDAVEWSKRIGQLGIGANSHVLVYDNNRAKDAGRIWWILRYWGVEDAKLLNGGWAGRTSGGFPVEQKENAPAAAPFAAQAHAERLATKARLLKSLTDANLQIVDARTQQEYCGIDLLTNKRGGAIPGAKQLEWIDLLDKETQRFKPAAELRRLFEQAGIRLDQPTATHCQSGGRASVMAFGLELMGAKDVSNYYASWAEWGNDEETPIVPGKPKEKEKEK